MKNEMSVRIIHIDQMVQECGFFTSDTTVNNAYGCKHPDQEETDIDYRTEKPHGKCYCFSCPMGHEADLEDLKNHDQELYDEWKNEEHDLPYMGSDLLVTSHHVTEVENSVCR